MCLQSLDHLDFYNLIFYFCVRYTKVFIDAETFRSP